MNGHLIFTGFQQTQEFSRGSSFAKSPTSRKPSVVELWWGHAISMCPSIGREWGTEPECLPRPLGVLPWHLLAILVCLKSTQRSREPRRC